MRKPTGLLGVPVDVLSMADTLSTIFRYIDQHQTDHVPRYIATVNVDFFVHIYSCWKRNVQLPELLQVLRKADLLLADGMPLVWLSRLIGGSLDQRIAGSSLVPLLAEAAAKKGHSLFLLGGEPSITQQAADNLSRQFPGLMIAGVATPTIAISHSPDQQEVDRHILEELDRVQPDILLIGLGSPKQELWFDRVRSHLKVPISIGTGGTFKFIAGVVRRAPEWMQNVGLEWLFRWMQEPRALTVRYLRDLIEFPLLTASVLFWSGFSDEAHPTANGFVVRLEQHGQWFAILHLPSVFVKRSCDHVETLIQTLSSKESLIIDFSALKALDASGAGLLLELFRLNRGIPLRAEGITGHAEKLLRLHRVWNVVSA